MKTITNLLKVKSIITLAIIFIFCYKTLHGDEVSPIFAGFAGSIITYYFTKGEKEHEHHTTQQPQSTFGSEWTGT